MTTTYDLIEAQVLTLTQALSRFTGHTNRVALNYSVLDKGEPEAVVILPGAFSVETEAALMNYRDWDLKIQAFTRIGDNEAAAWMVLRSLRGDLIDQHAHYPTLNHLAGVTETHLMSDGDPDYVYDKANNGPFFIMQSMRLTVSHRVDLSGGEF